MKTLTDRYIDWAESKDLDNLTLVVISMYLVAISFGVGVYAGVYG